MDKQGNTYTFIYATVMVILVAALLAFVSQVLKPTQNKNEEIAKKIEILRSVNIESTAIDAEAKYEQYIGANAYILNMDGQKQEGSAFSVDLAKEIKKDPAQRAYPIYECTLDGGVKKFIIPMRGKGLWGPIWGFVSLNDDKKSIYGATFEHKGETPGLGAEINKTPFQEPFKGKTIFKDDKLVSIQVIKGGAHIEPNHEVDAISGGTITSKGVENMLKDCFAGYEKFLKN